MTKDKETLGRILAGLLAGGAMLAVVGFPMSHDPGSHQALQREPQLQRIALQRDMDGVRYLGPPVTGMAQPDQFGSTNKQALQRTPDQFGSTEKQALVRGNNLVRTLAA